ncbi:lipid asymmetry maintenance protein MlaB [Entomohabitans teleogrylli]|uniref:lipid asymmetry maintenance protein MlaB n=1 Tax=Entomohabitans teleogrylli TaxID=1384589 RepID=UPI00073D4A07|nr:lipid asymmetry maintenance protein MlaB [Entomohabitans teleogrylli]
MASALRWEHKAGRLALSGELESETLNPLWDEREQVTRDISHIDVSGLSRVDTAGLALLVHLVSLAQRQRKDLQVTGAGDKLTTLAQLYNLSPDLLPLA